MLLGLVSAVFLLEIVRLHFTCASPCDNYTELNNAKRHINYTATWYETLQCDDHLSTTEWNRFTGPAGDTLADNTHIPSTLQCGTAGPLYLSSKHPPYPGPNDKSQCNVPAPGGIYNLCASFGVSDCDVKLPVDIHQCCAPGETFFVYRLKTPITGCPVALCGAGKQQALCPFGTIPKGPDCIPRFPAMLDPPKLTGPHIDGDDFTFRCEIKPDVNNDSINETNYEVQFLFDGENETNAIGPANYTNGFKATLNQMDIEGKIGKRITCRAQGFWTGKPSGGGYIHSKNSYWAGIQVYQIEKNGNRKQVWAIHLDKAKIKPFEIELHSTLPILFGSHRDMSVSSFMNKFPNSTRPSSKLQVAIKTRINDFSVNGGSGAATCSVSLFEGDWKTTRDDATVSNTTLTVVPIVDGKHDVDRNLRKRYLSLQTNNFFFPSIWKNYHIADIPVYIVDHLRRDCLSSGDPHITSFDGKFFNLFEKGEYIMAKLVTNFLFFEVRARTWHCNYPRRVTCNCAIAAREGNDIFIVDKCNSRGIPRVWYRTPACGEVCPLPGNYIQTLDSGNKYVIRFNSGASVVLTSVKRFMRATIQVPAYFKNMKMTGLCGNYDGKSSNDAGDHNNGYRSPFLERHRVKSQKRSLFEPMFSPDAKTSDAEMSSETKRRYCHCQRVSQNNNAIFCDATKQFKDPNNIAGSTDITEELAKQILNKRRRRRSVPDSIYSDNLFVGFETDYDMSEVTPVESQVDLSQGLSRKDAENYCYKTLRNSTIYNLCLTLDTFSINSTLSSCLEDLQITGEKQFAVSARQAMEETCKDEANKIAPPPTPEELWDPFAPTPATPANSTDGNWQTTTPAGYSSTPKGPSLAELLESQACPASCSGQGDCISGTCTCYHGYTSADCSIPDNKAPEILALSGGSLCDVEVRPCLKMHLFAEPIYDSANFTCRVSKVKVDLKTGVRSSVPFETTHTRAELISFAELICHLPREPIIPPTKDIAPVGNPVQGLLLSVSNDGVNFSEEVPLTLYDSVCMNCSISNPRNISEEPLCTRKHGTCLIDGYCHADGDPNPARPLCQHCDVKTSEDHFTNVTVTTQCDKCLGFPCFCDGKGWQCQCGAGYTINTKTLGCIDVDECKASGPCPPNSVCNNIIGSFECPCKSGFKKTIFGSCVDVNECTNPGVCPGQHCVNLEGSFRCQDCPIGYSSPGCKDINECQDSTQPLCYEYGTCLNTDGSYKCIYRECPPQFQKVGTKCIYISSDTANFWDANAKCRNLGKGFGRLTIIEDKFLYKIMANKMASDLSYWIGILSENDGSLKYVDGRPMPTNNYNEWDTTFKANSNMQCAVMSGPKGFEWIMRNCDESLPYACEAPVKNDQILIG